MTRQPINACLFTLLKMMIVCKQKGSPIAKLHENDYSEIAGLIYGDVSKTSNLRRRIFSEGNEAKYTYDMPTLDALTYFLETDFHYEHFNDFAIKNSEFDIVLKYADRSKLRRIKKDFSLSEQSEIYAWAKERCLHLFKQKEQAANSANDTGKSLFTSLEKERAAVELARQWDLISEERVTSYYYICDTKKKYPALTLADIEQHAEEYEKKCIKKLFIFFERVVKEIKNDYIDTDRFLADINGHFEGFYQNIFSVFFPIPDSYGRHWKDRNEVIMGLLELLPYDRVKSRHSPKFVSPGTVSDMIDASIDSEHQIPISQKEFLSELKNLNSYLDFSWDKPDSFFKMQSCSHKVLEILAEAKKNDIKEPDAYFLRNKFASFRYHTGGQKGKEEAIELWKYNIRLLPKVFNDRSRKYKEEKGSLLHQIDGRATLNITEVDYCIETWGPNSAQTVKALACRACLLIRAKNYGFAEKVLQDCEKIKDSKKFTGKKPLQKHSYIDVQYGKIYYFKAKAFEKSNLSEMRSNIKKAIEHFERALEDYFSANPQHVTKNYVHFYLYECYKLLGLQKEMKFHLDICAPFLSFFPGDTCHVERDIVLASLKKDI